MQRNRSAEDIRVYLRGCVDCLHVIQIAAAEMELDQAMVEGTLFGLANSMEHLLQEMDRHFMHIPSEVFETAADAVAKGRTGGCLT